jgi:hypothetical protein
VNIQKIKNMHYFNSSEKFNYFIADLIIDICKKSMHRRGNFFFQSPGEILQMEYGPF